MLKHLVVLIAIYLYSTFAIAEESTIIYGPETSPLPPIRIVGDKDYAPIEWLEEGKAKGIYSSRVGQNAKSKNSLSAY